MRLTPSLTQFRARGLFLLALPVLVAVSLHASAADPAGKARDDAKQKEAAPEAFTNKSLDNLPAPPPPTSLDRVVAAPAPAATSADDELVITNETLEKLFGPSDPQPPPTERSTPEGQPAAGSGEARPALMDPLAAMAQEKEDALKRQEAQAAAQKDVTTAEANVRELEQRLLAQQNPFLPRPKLTPEEQAKEQALDGAERARRTQEQLDLAKKELERARGQAGQSSPQR